MHLDLFSSPSLGHWVWLTLPYQGILANVVPNTESVFEHRGRDDALGVGGMVEPSIDWVGQGCNISMCRYACRLTANVADGCGYHG